MAGALAEIRHPWVGPFEAVNDFATLAGDFAEAFTVWQLGGTSGTAIAPPLTGDHLAVLAPIVP